MNYLVVSSSLNPDSRSRILAKAAMKSLEEREAAVRFLDLSEYDLPVCDGGLVYGNSQVQEVARMVEQADGILMASPIYNYDLNASAKNLVELTGKAWMSKVAGFLVAAGGQGSYMAVMGLANSLMLDFRTFVIPRFVYATGADFQGKAIADAELTERVEGLAAELIRVTSALRG